MKLVDFAYLIGIGFKFWSIWK